MKMSRTLIELDGRGTVRNVFIQNNSRACYTHPQEPSQVRLWYAAYQKMYELLYENGIRLVPKTGQTIFFNNTRVLHGREGVVTGRRALVGWYWEWDFVHSRIRCLQGKL